MLLLMEWFSATTIVVLCGSWIIMNISIDNIRNSSSIIIVVVVVRGFLLLVRIQHTDDDDVGV